MRRFPLIHWLKSKASWVRTHDEAIARWVSNLLSPPVVGSFLVVGLIAFVIPDPGTLWRWLALTLPLASLPPLAYVLWLVRRGDLADIHMPHRRARLKPLSAIMIWLFACFILLHKLGAPPVIGFFLLTGLLQIGVLSLVTLFWQISFHSATISAAAATVLALGGVTTWPITVTLLVPLVGWSRVRLRRHTLKQVTAGCVVGIAVALLMLIGLSPLVFAPEGG